MIYFIQAETGLIKIGFTDGNPAKRLAQLQVGSPVSLKLLKTTPGSAYDEAALHWRFREGRSHGEWFQPTPQLLEFIRDAPDARPFSGVKESSFTLADYEQVILRYHMLAER